MIETWVPCRGGQRDRTETASGFPGPHSQDLSYLDKQTKSKYIKNSPKKKMYPTSGEVEVRCKQRWELNVLDSVGGCVHAGTDVDGRGLVPALRLRGRDSLTRLAEFSPSGAGKAFAFELLLSVF